MIQLIPCGTGESESDNTLGKASDTVDTVWDWGKGVIQLIQCGSGERESDNTVWDWGKRVIQLIQCGTGKGRVIIPCETRESE